ERSEVACAAAAHSAAALAAGSLCEARVRAEEAVQVVGSTVDGCFGQPHLRLGRALAAADRLAEAEACYEAGWGAGGRDGAAWVEPLWRRHRAALRLAAGRLPEAADEAEAAVLAADRLRVPSLTAPALGVWAPGEPYRREPGPAPG